MSLLGDTSYPNQSIIVVLGDFVIVELPRGYLHKLEGISQLGLKRYGKHKVYEAAASVTKHTFYSNLFLWKENTLPSD